MNSQKLKNFYYNLKLKFLDFFTHLWQMFIVLITFKSFKKSHLCSLLVYLLEKESKENVLPDANQVEGKPKSILSSVYTFCCDHYILVGSIIIITIFGITYYYYTLPPYNDSSDNIVSPVNDSSIVSDNSINDSSDNIVSPVNDSLNTIISSSNNSILPDTVLSYHTNLDLSLFSNSQDIQHLLTHVPQHL